MEQVTDQMPLAVIDVFSDVQGSLDRMSQAVVPGLLALEPGADTLVVNGDAVDRGELKEWSEFTRRFDEEVRGHYQLVLFTVGNHEYHYGGATTPDQFAQRFLEQTRMDRLWGETKVGPLTVLWIGSEGYLYNRYKGSGPYMEMSEEQLGWLEERLEHHWHEGNPTVLFSHHVLPDTVTGTRTPSTANDFGRHRERVERALGDFPPTLLVTSHTHWSVRADDWAVERTFGSPAGSVTIVNSGAVTTQYGPSEDGDEEPIPGQPPSALKIVLYRDHLWVRALEFGEGVAEVVNEVRIPMRTAAGSV